MAEHRPWSAGEQSGPESSLPGDPPVAHGVGAAEDDVESTGFELVVDPLASEAADDQLLAADNTVLSGRQRRDIPEIANWSRFVGTIATNLDQLGILWRWHDPVSAWGG
jgi:hypothetical protein